MKKRVLAVLMALCISSLNTMGAFAAAAENDMISQAAEEESAMEEEGQTLSYDEEEAEKATEEIAPEGSIDSMYEENDSVPTDADFTDTANSDEENYSIENAEKGLSTQEKTTLAEDEKDSLDIKQSDGFDTVDNENDNDSDNGETDITNLEDEVPVSGECGAEGDNLIWQLITTDDGISLFISGNGYMMNYSEEAKAPWSENAGNIRYISLEEGVKSIGSYAFADCSNIKEVEISENVLSVGENAFYNCGALAVIHFSGTREDWNQINHCEIPDATEVFFGQESEIEINTIALNETELKLDIGEQYQLEVSFDPEGATNKEVAWASSDDEVVMVDDNGIVSANGIGIATITVTSANGKYAECKVEVESLYYNISYVLNGGTNAEENPSTYSKNDPVKFLDPFRKGYVFDGWYTDEKLTQKVTGIEAGQTGDLTIYAKWTGKTYKIVFNGNSADSGKMSKISYTVGKTASLPGNTFKKKEYVFNGWNTKANGKGIGFKNKGSLGSYDAANGSTITLYAQWKLKDYSIVYKLNGGTNNKSNPATYNFKTAVTSLAKPTRKGYTFKGWFTDAKFKNPFKGINKGSSGNKTVYAKWEAIKYKISYVLNGGTAPKGNPTNYYVTTATIKLKNPTKKNYTFGGWYKDAKFKTKITSIPKGSVGSLKLYAKWTPTKYKITYKMNGGTNNKSNPATYTVTSANITLAKPTKKGCVFAGWYSDSKFKNKVTVIKKGTTGNKTLYARWKIYEYSITYNLNGGKFPIGNPASYNVNTATIKLKDATKKGYVFAGWYKESTFKTKVTTIPKGSTGNLKLYAKWEEKKTEEEKSIDALKEYIIRNGVDYDGGKRLIFTIPEEESTTTCYFQVADSGKLWFHCILEPKPGISSYYSASVVSTSYDLNEKKWNGVAVIHHFKGVLAGCKIEAVASYDHSSYYPGKYLSFVTVSDNTKYLTSSAKNSLSENAVAMAFSAWEVLMIREIGKSFVDLGFSEFNSH